MVIKLKLPPKQYCRWDKDSYTANLVLEDGVPVIILRGGVDSVEKVILTDPLVVGAVGERFWRLEVKRLQAILKKAKLLFYKHSDPRILFPKYSDPDIKATPECKRASKKAIMLNQTLIDNKKQLKAWSTYKGEK